MCGAVTSQKYRLCGNEREKSRSHLILRESRGWSSRFQPFVGRADERRFCCVTVVLPLMSILKTQCYKGSRKKNRNSIDKNYGIAKATVEDMAVFFLLAIHCCAGTLSSWFMGDEARNNSLNCSK